MVQIPSRICFPSFRVGASFPQKALARVRISSSNFIAVHDNQRYDSTRVVSAPIEGLARSVGALFGHSYEYITANVFPDNPNAANHVLEVDEMLKDRTSFTIDTPNMPLDIKRTGIIQPAADYSLPGLSGNIFTLAGGGIGRCHWHAFKNLLGHISFNAEGRIHVGEDVFEIHLPSDAIYENFIRTERYDDEYTDYIDAEQLNPERVLGHIGAYTELAGGKDYSLKYSVLSSSNYDEFVVERSNSESPKLFIIIWPSWKDLAAHLSSRIIR